MDFVNHRTSAFRLLLSASYRGVFCALTVLDFRATRTTTRTAINAAAPATAGSTNEDNTPAEAGSKTKRPLYEGLT